MGTDPAAYRDEDGDDGPLRALVEVLAEQAAIVRRSTDRLWDDEFIDLCDDWAVPYLGDLVGTRMVSALDQRGRRVDVANTIYYRRRAGTLAVLEGLTADITGWEGTVVEEFRDLLRHPHGLDSRPAATGAPAPGHRRTGCRTCARRVAAGWPGARGTSSPTCPTPGGTTAASTAATASPSWRSISTGWLASRCLRATPRVLAADATGRRRSPSIRRAGPSRCSRNTVGPTSTKAGAPPGNGNCPGRYGARCSGTPST